MAFDIPYFYIRKQDSAGEIIDRVLEEEGMAVCEVFVDERQEFAPKASSKVLQDGRIISPSMDDMAPFLDRDEYIQVSAEWKRQV